MTVILNASNTAGLVLTSDTSGNVAIQSNGANAITIDNTQNLSIASGNLIFSGTAQRITGDFSNATAASRVMVQTSTANGATTFGIIPNGTNDVANFMALNNSSDQANASYFQFRIGSGESRIRSDVNGTGTQLPMTFYVGGSERMRIDTNGYLLVGYTSSNGAYKLQVNSQIFATSSTIATSDANYKTNVKPITGALNIVEKLNPVSFNWKPHPVHNFDVLNPTTGFLAQEVQEALVNETFVNSIVKKSEVTLEDGAKEEFFGIAEGNMISILTKAIQEQQAMIVQLQSDVAALKGAK